MAAAEIVDVQDGFVGGEGEAVGREKIVGQQPPCQDYRKLLRLAPILAHFPEKWSPVFRRNGGREEKPKVHYLPLPLLALLVGAFLVVVALIQIGILRYALPEQDVQSGVEASHDHRHHRIRRDRHRLRTDAMAGTLIAVNVGGAVCDAPHYWITSSAVANSVSGRFPPCSGGP
jgi:hypothetical protein